jgi:lysophospholipase L1-like esterase
MRRLLADLVMMIVSVLATLLMCEIGLRLFWDGYYLKLDQAYAQNHPTRGWSNTPGAEVPYGEPEFVTTVRHNALGFRGAEVGPKQADRVRVLVLGDSFAYGVGVENDETFSARLEALEPRLEVINTGVNGYGTGQQLLVLREDGLPLQPDVVIVAFFWNDFENTLHSRFARFELQDGKLVQLPGRPVTEAEKQARTPNRPWLRYSYFYRFWSDRVKIVRYRVRVALGQPVEDGVRMTDDERQQAYALTFGVLSEIDRLVRGAGARLLLVSLPEQVQVQPDAQVTGLEAIDYEVQERLAEFAARAGIAYLDLLPALRDAYARGGQPLYYRQDRHFRANGHALVAQLIRDDLAARGWLAPLSASPSAPAPR